LTARHPYIASRMIAAILVLLMAAPLLFGSCELIDRADHVGARIAQASLTVEINVTVADNVGRNISAATVHIEGNTTTWETSSEGYILIGGLADDVASYQLWASKDGYIESARVVCEVQGNQTSNITVEIFGGAIGGIVTSSTGFVEGGIVSISPLGYWTTVSPTNGSYALLGIPAGFYSVTAGAPGYLDSNDTVTLGIGGFEQKAFVLTPRDGEISGFVFRELGFQPLSSVNVSVIVLPGELRFGISGSDGNYTIKNIPEGTYTVSALKEGFFAAEIAGIAVVREVVTENVNLTLTERPTALYGAVRSGTLLLPGVNITVVGTSFQNMSDSTGSFRIENITAGTYNVTASLVGYEPALLEGVVIPVGGETRLDINLTALPGAVLRGTVVASDSGEGLPNVLVTIVTPESGTRSTTTNVHGEFEFTSLVGGNYTIRFSLENYQPLEMGDVEVAPEAVTNMTFKLQPLRGGFEGFIFGFDMAHSMMILALFLTIIMLAIAVYLRIRTFQAPESAPAVYDQAEEEEAEEKKESPEEIRPE